MTRRNVQKQGWVFPLSPDSDDRLSLNFHRFVVFICCDTRSGALDNTVYRCCAIALNIFRVKTKQGRIQDFLKRGAQRRNKDFFIRG